MTLDESRPAEPEPGRRAGRARLRRPLAGAATFAPDSRAEARQQRGQHGERRQERQEHGERGRHRDAVEEADAEREHAQQGDDHRAAGEDDRSPGGVHRRQHGRVRLGARPVVLTESGDDEQGVVDPDPQADHHRQLGGEVRHVQNLGSQGDQPDPGPQSEQGGDDRQPHRHERAEGDQEHDDGGQHPDRGGEPKRRLLGRLDCLSSQLDLKVAGPRSLAERDHLIDGGRGELVGALIEVDGGESDAAVLGDRVGACRTERADHAADVRHLGHLPQHRRDLCANPRCVDPAGGGA